MFHSPIEILRHIQDEIDYLETMREDNSKEGFLEDETLRRASVRSIEIIGEATKRLSDEFREEHEVVAWKEMAGMRDHLIHEYFGVDFEIVWDVIDNKIPEIKPQITKIINELEEE
jgi:uncharacterized protein with HEPN domain